DASRGPLLKNFPQTPPMKTYAPGDPIPSGSGAARAILGEPVPLVPVSPSDLMRKGKHIVIPGDPLPPLPTSGSATAGTATPGGGVCPADNPIGVYPNCCPRYTISDGHGGCGGSDGSYTPKANEPPRVSSGSAVARACPADNPIGIYPNCCPRYMISDGHGGCSGSDGSYTPKSNEQPRVS